MSTLNHLLKSMDKAAGWLGCSHPNKLVVIVAFRNKNNTQYCWIKGRKRARKWQESDEFLIDNSLVYKIQQFLDSHWNMLMKYDCDVLFCSI